MAVAGLLAQVSTAQKLDRTIKPKPGPAPVINIKDPVVYKLSNGITVLVVQDNKLPKVSASYSIDAGPITEGDKAGVIDLLSGMLNEGTSTRTKQEFSAEVAKMGAEVKLSAYGGSASALTRFFPQAFLLMSSALRNPSFDPAAFEKLKSIMITNLKSSERNGKAVSGRVVNAIVYGLDHPLGEFATDKTVGALKIEDLKEIYQKYITPSRGYLTIVGDIKPSEAKALAIQAFGDWKGTTLSYPKLALVGAPAKTEVDVVDLPNLVQSEITLVNLIDLPLSSPDYHAVLLANEILGGGADSKLFRNLREKHAFTYGAYSKVGAGRTQTTFNASASVRNEKVDSAVVEMVREINVMRSEKVDPQVLQNTKNYYNGSFALGLETTSRSASFASNILINDLPKDFYRTYLQKINAVTPEDILRVSKKYFSADNAKIVIVGKAEKFVPGLKAAGFIVKGYDKNAMPVKGL